MAASGSNGSAGWAKVRKHFNVDRIIAGISALIAFIALFFAIHQSTLADKSEARATQAEQNVAREKKEAEDRAKIAEQVEADLLNKLGSSKDQEGRLNTDLTKVTQDNKNLLRKLETIEKVKEEKDTTYLNISKGLAKYKNDDPPDLLGATDDILAARDTLLQSVRQAHSVLGEVMGKGLCRCFR
jgi:septal ring factor EnvC (AmiA/AmiB activator)